MVTFLAVLLIGVYISQLIRFARVGTHNSNFNAILDIMILISKFNAGLKTLLCEGLSEPEFYSDSGYKFKKLIGRNVFSFRFRKIISCYRRIGYNSLHA